MTRPQPTSDPTPRPLDWARRMIAEYESGAASQFILHGNVHDRIAMHVDGRTRLGNLHDYLVHVLLPGFDVILSYTVGHGIRVEKGEALFNEWPHVRSGASLPRAPRQAIEALTHYFRYVANLRRMARRRVQVGLIVESADLVAPLWPGGVNYDLSALAMLMRDWSMETTLVEHPLATILVSENINDLHGLLVNNPRALTLKIPLPAPEDLSAAFALFRERYPEALAAYRERLGELGAKLAGATLNSIERLFKYRQYAGEPIGDADLAGIKKAMVEDDCNGLIEFMETDRTLEDLHGVEPLKKWVRQDIALWHRGDLAAMPMGYLLCGPVGSGKTFLVRCIAGEAGVPVVRLKNFRDKWVGSSEGNLERIFRLLQALGRCIVFIDEADQSLGSRGGGGDSGVSGRLYAMMAEEMSNPANRGRILWILASSRPDMIEVDLKRPGRVDVKIPILPTATPDESFGLLCALCRKLGLAIEPADAAELTPLVPPLLTPGSAEALAVRVYRECRTREVDAKTALRECLVDYQNPIPRDVLDFQIELAVREASDLTFVDPAFRHFAART